MDEVNEISLILSRGLLYSHRHVVAHACSHVERLNLSEAQKAANTDHRARVICVTVSREQVGRPADDEVWLTVPQRTRSILKMPHMFRGMSYFPVIVQTAHLRALRVHVELVHGVSFDTVFRTHCAPLPQCSGVDVMLTKRG